MSYHIELEFMWIRNAERKRYGMLELVTALEKNPIGEFAHHLSLLKTDCIEASFPGFTNITNPFSLDPANLPGGQWRTRRTHQNQDWRQQKHIAKKALLWTAASSSWLSLVSAITDLSLHEHQVEEPQPSSISPQWFLTYFQKSHTPPWDQTVKKKQLTKWQHI